MSKVKEFLKSKKAKVITAVSAASLMIVPVTAFADETGGSSFPITSDMLSGVTSNFNSAVAVAAPAGISIMCVILGIKFVPRLVKMLAK